MKSVVHKLIICYIAKANWIQFSDCKFIIHCTKPLYEVDHFPKRLEIQNCGSQVGVTNTHCIFIEFERHARRRSVYCFQSTLALNGFGEHESIGLHSVPATSEHLPVWNKWLCRAPFFVIMLFVSKKAFFSQYYIASFRYLNLFIRKSDVSTFIFCILHIKINYLQRDVMDISSNDGDAAPHKFFNIPRKKLMRSHNLIMEHLFVFMLCFGRRPNSGDRSAEDAMTSLIKKCTWPVQCWDLS